MGSRPFSFPTLSQVLSIYGLRAKKELSQNFLLKEGVVSNALCIFQRCKKNNDVLLEKICRYLQTPLTNDLVIEIGPGPGGLTRELLKLKPRRLLVIEKDSRFLPILKQLQSSFPALDISISDAVEMLGPTLSFPGQDFISAPPSRVQIVGNLPFKISSVLLSSLLEALASPPPSPLGKLIGEATPVEMVLMFQKEVAQKIVARPGSGHRGRLSILCQNVCDVELCMTIPGREFTPAPEVDAAVVRFSRKRPVMDFSQLQGLLKMLFAHPRKTILSNLRKHFPAATDDSYLEISDYLRLRPGELTDSGWLVLDKWLQKFQGQNKLRHSEIASQKGSLVSKDDKIDRFQE